MEFDIERLRSDLINYFGSATPFNSFAYSDLIEIENANPYKLINIALNNGFDLENYVVGEKTR